MEGTDLEKLVIRLVGDSSAYQQMLSTATAATQRFASTTGTILASAGLSFGLMATAIKSVQLAGQFEAMSVDLEVLAGSTEKARGMIEELNVFAAKTPFELPGLMNSTKMLMQFGVESDQIVPLLKLLGNAAGGNQQKLDQLSLAFGHVISQGRITGYSFRQMIFSGFNPLKEISKMTGESVASLTEKMHKGKIGSDIIVAALNNASKAGGSFAGRLERASTTLTGLFSTMKDNIGFVMREIGGIIIEGLNLKEVEIRISDAAMMITGWLKTISPEAKRVAAIVLAVVSGLGLFSFALFALGPVFGLVGTLLGPVVSLLKVLLTVIGFILSPIRVIGSILGPVISLFASIASTIIFLLSPIGLLTVAIGGLIVAFFYFTDAGSQMAVWFGKTLATIKDFFMPAIQGIKDAITAGDITLAFEILWAQIKLTFFQGIKPLRDAWTDFVFFFKKVWIESSTVVQSTWDTVQTGIASGITWLAQKAGIYTAEQAAGIQERLAGDHKATLDKLEKDRTANIDAALEASRKANAEANEQLSGLYKKRDELAAKAAADAAKVKPELPVEPKLDPSKFKPPDQKMKVTPEVKWEASLAEGAEAVSRMIAYGMNLVGFGPGLGAHGGRGAGGAGGMGGEMGGGMGAEGGFGEGPNPIQAGGMEDDPARDKMVSLLGEVANNTGTMAKKPGINVATANL
jgi:tape measure domain-containing protein